MKQQQGQQEKPVLSISRRDKEEAQDAALAVVKGLVSGLPGVGPVVGELMGTVIPNRRMDRFEKMLAYFAARVCHLSPEYLEIRMKEPEFIDVFEQGVYSAVKALLEERINVIGSITGSSLSPDRSIEEGKFYLDVVESLTDLEIFMLMKLNEDKKRDGDGIFHLACMTHVFYDKITLEEASRVDGNHPLSRMGEAVANDLTRKNLAYGATINENKMLGFRITPYAAKIFEFIEVL